MSVHFSSATDQWATPQDYFDKVAARFNFVLDVCADQGNAKCKDFFTKEDDGLKQDWVAHISYYWHLCGDIWMNPPYGRSIGDWVRKAYETSRGGGNGSLLASCAHRYALVAQLLHEGRDRVYPWAAQVWRLKKFCPVSISPCCFSGGE